MQKFKSVNTTKSINSVEKITCDICNKEIKKGDIVLIDLWAKMNTERGTVADITWDGYAGSEIGCHLWRTGKGTSGNKDRPWSKIRPK